MSQDVSVPIVNTKKERIESFYLLKAIASFFVVLIHTSLWHKLAFDFIAGIGTPCFLAITGYLLYSNDCGREITKCLNWAKKSFLLSFSCNIVYAIPKYFYAPELIMDPWVWINALFFRGGDLCIALWYLTSLWHGLLLFAIFRRFLPKIIYILPFIFVLLYLWRNQNSPYFPFYLDALPFGIERNTFLTTLTFLATGYLVHQHKNILLRWINVDVVFPIVLLLAFIEGFANIIFLHYSNLFNFTTYPLIILTILLCIKHPSFKVPLLNDIGKKHSANIYYFHMLFVFYIWNRTTYPNTQTILVWLSCIPFSMLFNVLSERIKKLVRNIKPFMH